MCLKSKRTSFILNAKRADVFKDIHLNSDIMWEQ